MDKLPSVLLLGDPLLRRVAKPVTRDMLKNSKVFEKDMQQLCSVLHAFREKHGFGRAIAAPQLGMDYRMIAINLSQSQSQPQTRSLLPGMRSHDDTFVILNPTLTYQSTDSNFTMWDDCMSFPDLMVKVQRREKIAVQWMDVDGREQEWGEEQVSVDLSELLQHEMDHLDGVLSTDRALDKESIVFRQVWEQYNDYFKSMVDYTIY